ncbi:UNKNOWN [Stylonychia lemnae]|uniref:Uncharacterized protein n=1 Tax=Stylonychia lemnae TaxID=5949 RepID=A0A078AK81_STYLE|nr:UNKNOWN [Stylonychia lemnae]|eukprot:CDW81862.1 UNKNOWN [Stylonychia lemnae]
MIRYISRVIQDISIQQKKDFHNSNEFRLLKKALIRLNTISIIFNKVNDLNYQLFIFNDNQIMNALILEVYFSDIESEIDLDQNSQQNLEQGKFFQRMFNNNLMSKTLSMGFEKTFNTMKLFEKQDFQILSIRRVIYEIIAGVEIIRKLRSQLITGTFAIMKIIENYLLKGISEFLEKNKDKLNELQKRDRNNTDSNMMINDYSKEFYESFSLLYQCLVQLRYSFDHKFKIKAEITSLTFEFKVEVDENNQVKKFQKKVEKLQNKLDNIYFAEIFQFLEKFIKLDIGEQYNLKYQNQSPQQILFELQKNLKSQPIQSDQNQEEEERKEYEKYLQSDAFKLVQENMLNELLNIKNSTLKTLELNLEEAYEFCNNLYQDQEQRKKSFISKSEIIKSFFYYLLALIRGIRAFNFTENICKYLKLSFEFLKEKASDSKQRKIKDAISICYEKLRNKALNDENLKEIADFQSNIKLMAVLNKEISSYVLERIAKNPNLKQKLEIKVDLIGLSGAGIQFKNSTIKIQISSKWWNLVLDEVKIGEKDQNYFIGFRILKFDNSRRFYVKFDQQQGISQEIASFVFKIKVDYYESQRDVMLPKLIKSYLELGQGIYKRMATFWIFFLRLTQLSGYSRQYQYISSTSYLLILINFLQSQYQLPNLQEDKDKYNPSFLSQEKLTTYEKEQYEKRRSLDSKNNNYNPDKRTLTVSYFMLNDDWAKSKDEQLRQQRQKILPSSHKEKFEVTLMRFFRFICNKISQRSMIIDVQKGKMKSTNRDPNYFLVIWHPFIPQINLAEYFTNEKEFQRLIKMHKELIRAAGENRLMEFIINVAKEFPDDTMN